MSYLNSYRINFWGGISTNPCTSNNDDVNSFFVDPVTAMLSPCLIGMSDDDAVKKLESNPGWNYFGDYVTKFDKATISSFGLPGTPETTGDIIDQGVYMLGSLDPKNSSPDPVGSPILVDMDSTGTSCTQILVGGLQIGGTSNPILRINEDTRCYTRSLQTVDGATGGGAFQMKSINVDPPGFGMANTSWQLSFEYSDDWVYDATNPQISTLVEKAKAAKGITMVFTQFEVMTIFSREAIIEEYAKGNGPINPVLGYTIGSIGIWEEGESDTCLPGRLLKAIKSEHNASISQCDTYVQLDESTSILSLNMASTFVKPKARTQAEREDINTMSPTVDPGSISIAVDINGTTEIVVGIPYSATDYHKFGGLVDVQLDAGQVSKIKQGDLYIVQTNNGAITNTISKEQTYRFISDDRGVYVDPNTTDNLVFNITKWGQAVTEDLNLDIVFSDSGQMSAQFEQHTEMNVGFSTADGTKIPFSVLSAKDHSYKGSTTIKASDAAAFELNAEWIQGGMKQVSLTVNGAKYANYYMVIRSYCDDDYSAIPDDQKYTWDYVYNEVLRYYYVVFPAMSLRLPLNNEVLISQQVYGVVKERVSDEYKNTTLLMPITRDMSPGKVKLLVDYFDHIHPA
jgi:hypothetical protein